MTHEPDITSPGPFTATEKPQWQETWLGPLFYWEMLREVRKIRSYLPRLVFSLLILLQLYLVLRGGDITQKQAAYFSERMVAYYLFFQYLAVALLTPIFLAGSIIEERQQGTLPLMLTTFLTPGEWLRGKMMGRLAPMLSVLIAGIPILSLMQLFGGVDITAVVVHTFLAAILMVATGMYSIYSSVHEKSAGSAVFATYMLLLGGTFLGYLAAWPVSAILVISSLASQLWLIAIATLTVILLHLWLGVRSFRTAVRLLEKRTGDYDVTRSPAEQLDLDTRLKSLETELVKAIRKPSVTSALEAKELEARAEILHHVANEKRKSRVYSHWPLVWKGAAFPPTTALIVTSFMVFLVNLSITLAFIFAATTRSMEYDAVQFDGFMKFTLVPLMMLVTLRASSLIVMERKQQTWLSLLTLPWSRTRLVAELATGALWRYRWLLFTCMLMILSYAVYLRIETTLALLAAYLSQLIFFCLLGLLISAISRTVLIARILVFAFFFAVFLCLPGMMQDTRWDGLSVLLPAQTWLSSAVSMNRIDFVTDVVAAVGIQTVLSAACFGAICLLIKLQVDR